MPLMHIVSLIWTSEEKGGGNIDIIVSKTLFLSALFILFTVILEVRGSFHIPSTSLFDAGYDQKYPIYSKRNPHCTRDKIKIVPKQNKSPEYTEYSSENPMLLP